MALTNVVVSDLHPPRPLGGLPRVCTLALSRGASGVITPGLTGPRSHRPPQPPPCVSGEATWSGSEFEVSFPDSPGAQAQQDHLPQLTLPDSLTSAASPEDGLSAELLEAQAEEEPASAASPAVGAEAEGAAGGAQLSTPE